MPRKSPESRSASYYHVGAKPPPPPAILSADAKILWRKVVNCRAWDYFDAASQELLAQFCEMCIVQRENLRMMREDPLNPERWQAVAAKMQTAINSLSVKLRVSPSTVLTKKSGRLDEKETDTDDNVLLFGGPGPVKF
jgi:hypothetical protein